MIFYLPASHIFGGGEWGDSDFVGFNGLNLDVGRWLGDQISVRGYIKGILVFNCHVCWFPLLFPIFHLCLPAAFSSKGMSPTMTALRTVTCMYKMLNHHFLTKTRGFPLTLFPWRMVNLLLRQSVINRSNSSAPLPWSSSLFATVGPVARASKYTVTPWQKKMFCKVSSLEKWLLWGRNAIRESILSPRRLSDKGKRRQRHGPFLPGQELEIFLSPDTSWKPKLTIGLGPTNKSVERAPQNAPGLFCALLTPNLPIHGISQAENFRDI